MQVDILSSRRIYRSPAGINVEKAEEHFSARKVRYKLVHDDGSTEEKVGRASSGKLDFDASTEEIEGYFLNKEEQLLSEEDDELESDDELDSDDETDTEEETED